MKTIQKHAIGENLLYFLVWSAILLVPIMNSQMMFEQHVNFDKVFIAWRQVLPYLIIFIIHNTILAPKLMLKRMYGKYVAADVALVCLVFCGLDLYEGRLGELLGLVDPAKSANRVVYTSAELYLNIMLGFFMTGANTGIKLIYQSIRDEQEMEELKRRNLQAEMDYLKYQINPHFFMNTLNNIHALIDIDPTSAQKALIELSKMMRYVLYDSGREKVLLSEDIVFLKNYIELMRIRYTETVDIEVDTPDNLPRDIAIPPLLPIVFVENAFKHGVSYNRKSFIRIKIRHENNKIICTISNSRHNTVNEHPAGIGLENVRKRLELLYGENNYTLHIDEEPATYTVKLVIPALHA